MSKISSVGIPDLPLELHLLICLDVRFPDITSFVKKKISISRKTNKKTN